MSSQKNADFGVSYFVSSLLIGTALCLLIVGWQGINPLNIGWFGGGDPLVHYLSWDFFRRSSWTMPIGLNPSYGLEIGSSIVYTDSIPLLAFIFKFFSPILPDTFHYLGLWTLISFIFQSYFGLIISRKITSNFFLQLLVSIFFIFTPIFLYRIGYHTALLSHFLILWAIYLCLSKDKIVSWMMLLLMSSAVNSYIFTMIFGLFFGRLCDCKDIINLKELNVSLNRFAIACVFLTLLILVFWQTGYFALPTDSVGIGGFGVQRINLLSPLNPQGWSYFLPAIPEAYKDLIGGETGLDFYARRSESFQFMGSGFILLFLLALPALWAMRQNLIQQILLRKYVSLILILYVFFAISNNIAFAQYQLSLPIPSILYAIASTWRGSARFFWPVIYILLITLFWAIICFYKTKKAFLIIASCLTIQICDTSSGWLLIQNKMSQNPSPLFSSPLNNPFWSQAAKKYSNIKALSLKYTITQPGWDTFGVLAQKYGLHTNIAYLARLNRKKIDQYNESISRMINTGNYDNDSFYILDEIEVPAVFKALKASDLLAKIDGYYVLAPNWYSCSDCSTNVQPYAQIVADQFVKPAISESISFAKGGNGIRYLVGGLGPHKNWDYPEEWGVWDIKSTAQVIIPVPNMTPQQLDLELRFPVSPIHQLTDFEISYDKSQPPLKLTSSSGIKNISIPISKSQIDNGYIYINFYIKKLITPKEIGIGTDDRQIGIGLASAIFK